MIDAAIGQVANALNNALQRAFGLSEELVVVSSLYEPDGSVAAGVNNKLAVFLVNIERDTMPVQRPRQADHSLLPPPVSLNLQLMFAASFGAANYTEALKFVASTVAFFQSVPLLDHHNTPGLDPRIDRLVLDIENQAIGELGNLWGIFGGRYVPSVLYRMRMVTFDAGRRDGPLPVVREPIVGAHA
ncbi:DUF4255 domain-containing protein [Pseudorhodoferax soli]|uniref:Uncharacterized protein DUF4255 n=1 Tax=Pseudorhodoferax soli TaxID=545864 RepID=A0A368Y859_9BURK|nr:DUF4255 domain-containing protein [Pseudorhodoferax soli]RCW76461.1 uncharacterized protein DUF4255 [Pseudorhodoferax soli]